MNEARQVLPPQAPTQSQKRKASEPPPPGEANSSTKRVKASEPGGLLPNWKRNASVDILTHIARKNPIQFVDDEDDLPVVEGEFDRSEGTDTLEAVRATKPATVRIDDKLVCVLIISDRTY